MGLPGETLEIKNGKIHADGKELGMIGGGPAIHYLSAKDLNTPSFRQSPILRLAEDQYFVLGDNSSSAFDSRFWGPVPREAVVGKVTRIYYPFQRMRSLSP